MNDIIVGNFKATMSSPYPVWVSIKYGSDTLHGISHTELLNLRHLVDILIRDAKVVLDKRAGEVE